MKTSQYFCSAIVPIAIMFIAFSGGSIFLAQADQDDSSDLVRSIKSPVDGNVYEPYPQTYAHQPQFPSPFKTADGDEYIVACLEEGKFAVIPVTINGMGSKPDQTYPPMRDQQLVTDAEDFPTLAATGLHSEHELDAVQTITGKAVEQISKDGRPEQFSFAGFMAEDEDIISVLKGDNRIVTGLGLTHTELATPLFHVWNYLILEYDLGHATAKWKPCEYFFYNGEKVHSQYVGGVVLFQAAGSKGYQESIFNDGIRGAFRIWLQRDLTEGEIEFLRAKYPGLSQDAMERMVQSLTQIHTGEMVPYYIMRYGFYEGHTSYRADPVAIAFIFGIRSLVEIEGAFPGELDTILTAHFSAHGS